MSTDLTSAARRATARAGLAPVRTTLPNGVVVIAKQTRKTPAVTINLALRAGSIADPSSLLGATHLLSRVIDRGTRTRTADSIADDLDSRGIALTVGVTRHTFSLTCTCLAGDFQSVLALLGDIVMAPTVPDSELTSRRSEVITGLRQDQDNPAIRAVEELMALMYGTNHPYGRHARGTIESVERITRDDLLRLHAARFAPSLLSVVVVGDVEPAAASDVAGTVFGGWNVPCRQRSPCLRPFPRHPDNASSCR